MGLVNNNQQCLVFTWDQAITCFSVNKHKVIACQLSNQFLFK